MKMVSSLVGVSAVSLCATREIQQTSGTVEYGVFQFSPKGQSVTASTEAKLGDLFEMNDLQYVNYQSN